MYGYLASLVVKVVQQPGRKTTGLSVKAIYVYAGALAYL
jgi:hypothetical protein